MANERTRTPFNVVLVAQDGRLQYEAALFCASLRAAMPRSDLRLFVAEPQPGPLWPRDPRMSDPAVRRLLDHLGAEILPFAASHFGAGYPYGNKIELLSALPEGEPFVFFDSDTLVLGDLAEIPFDFTRAWASGRVSGTWPKAVPGGPGHGAIWKALYDRFDLDLETALDPGRAADDWRRYPYFNAGCFAYRCPRVFGDLFLRYARSIADDPPPELAGQSLDPWLDQVALPLVIHALGGGRDALAPGWIDGSHTCHYRYLPLLYAREAPDVLDTLERVAAPDRIRAVLEAHEPMRRMIFGREGRALRHMIANEGLPEDEKALRQRLRAAGLWMR